MIEDVFCSICGSATWHNVDEFRVKEEGMFLCMKCGFITYPKVIQKAADLKQFYREEYRLAPTEQNLFTGQRKLHYHNAFLEPLFSKWKKDNKQPVIFEIGAAFGMFLKWVREHFPTGEFYGSELTLTYRRVAYHEYNFTFTEDFDESRQYDLIASYKVAEHIPYIEKELHKYKMALKPDGLLYISVPTWFHTLSNFGISGFDLGYYYHKNHINVWTRKLFETLLKKIGFEILEKDYIYYDSTYLCRRNDTLMNEPPKYEEPAMILDCLARVKKASQAMDMSKYEDALMHFPQFPQAVIAAYEHKRAWWHEKGFDVIKKDIIEKALEILPHNAEISLFVADLHMRYDKWDDALKYLEKTLKEKPGDPGAIIAMSNCFRQMGDRAIKEEDKINFYTQARDISKFLHATSFQHVHHAVNLIFQDDSRILMPNETS